MRFPGIPVAHAMTPPRRHWTFSLPELLLGATVICALVASVALSSKESTAKADGLPAILGSRMVLQRDVLCPIWGWADAGEEVTAEFARSTALGPGNGGSA